MSTDYSTDLVYRNDYGRYIATLLMPRASRPALFALYAFHAEIAAIPHKVSEPTLGMIRLQWWREAIARLYQGKPDAHETIRALEVALQNGAPWIEDDFTALIDQYEHFFHGEKGFVIDTTPLLNMSIAVTGEGSRKKLMRLFAYLKSRDNNDPSLALKIWWLTFFQ